jgi:hypothetical protein
MTDDQVSGLLLIALGMMILIWRKKRQNSQARPEIVYFEMIELIEVWRRPKVPEFVKNLAIVVAVIFVFIWVMKHS